MRFLPLIFTVLFVFTSNASASDYNYISPEKLKNNIESDIEMLVVDIQVEDEFTKHHIKGSIPTYAYPAKSDIDTSKLDIAILKYQEVDGPVVVVCPRGAGGAKRSYDYLKGKGIAEEKLLILEKGMAGWSYSEHTVTR